VKVVASQRCAALCEMGTVKADLIKILPKIMCLKKQDRKTAISPCIASNISLRFVLVQMQ